MAMDAGGSPTPSPSRPGQHAQAQAEAEDAPALRCNAGTQRGPCGRPVVPAATQQRKQRKQHKDTGRQQPPPGPLQLCEHHLADRLRGESASAAELRRRREAELASAFSAWVPPANGHRWPLAVSRVVYASIERVQLAMQRAGSRTVYTGPSHAGRVSIMVTEGLPLDAIVAMPPLLRQLQQNGGLLPVTAAATSLAGAVDGLAAMARERAAGRAPLRLQCVPAKILPQVLEACARVPEIDDRLDGAADEDSLNIAEVGASLYLYGYSTRRERLPAFFFPDTRPDAEPAKQRDLAAPPISDQVCRAAMKLQELGEGARPRLALSPAWYALDIGAAPGGWTQYLAAECRHVTAVDPAALDAGVLALGNVVHIREKVQTADAALRSNANPETGMYDLVVCDMNMAPDDAARCVLAAADYLRPGGKLVLTLKLVRKSKAYPAEAEAAVRSLLSPAFADFDVEWLFANTNRERTLLATRTTAPASEPSA